MMDGGLPQPKVTDIVQSKIDYDGNNIIMLQRWQFKSLQKKSSRSESYNYRKLIVMWKGTFFFCTHILPFQSHLIELISTTTCRPDPKTLSTWTWNPPWGCSTTSSPSTSISARRPTSKPSESALELRNKTTNKHFLNLRQPYLSMILPLNSSIFSVSPWSFFWPKISFLPLQYQNSHVPSISHFFTQDFPSLLQNLKSFRRIWMLTRLVCLLRETPLVFLKIY